MDALEARIARIEQALISRAMLTTPSVLEPRAPKPEAQAAQPRRSAADAERFLGGRILLAVGAVALLLGVSFFLKYAFDNGWIGPSGRVALGLVAGAAFLVGSARLRSLSQPVFAHGLGALGAGILYLSLWAAGNGFHLVPTAASFAGMCVVTALLVLLATRNDSQLMAIWGLIGGFLTPALNAGPQPSVVTLFAYLALLNAALVFVIEKRAWKIIAPVALVFTELYYFLSVGHNGNHVLRDIGFAALYLALFMSGPARRALQGKTLDRSNVTVTILSAISFYAALHLQFYDSERMLLVAAIVALAAAYVFLAVKTQDVARTLFAALALALVTGGIAIAFHGSTVAALWAIEGALLVWTGARAKLQLVQFFGILAFAMALLDVSFIPLAGGRLFANDRFWTLAIFAGSFAAA
ncbi:MAG TPA: DUF2339 domain-containing protein, partial [Candidatus Aquilonibacter sp.]|nr:DUF2339 domain-containing protein [Candidatus Aquilonibacter sp.]